MAAVGKLHEKNRGENGGAKKFETPTGTGELFLAGNDSAQFIFPGSGIGSWFEAIAAAVLKVRQRLIEGS